MIRRIAFAVVGVVLAAVASSAAEAQTEIQQRLRTRVEAGLTTDSFDVMDERMHARQTLRRLYPSRDFRPLWIAESGMRAHAEEFAQWLATGPTRHGLRGEHYHLGAIETLEADRLGALVDLELALSDAFLIVGSHLLAGRLNPETLDSEWLAARRHRDLAPLLERVETGAPAGVLLEELLPAHAEYRVLVDRLAMLRGIRDEGGWPRVDDGPPLRQGDKGPRVAQLRSRLRLAGDLAVADPDDAHALANGLVEHALSDALGGDAFDEAVAAAVVRFQTRHGLATDGVVGRATLAALNVPIQDRINQLIVNLERWRWLPESLGERHVIVNIAGFRLDVVENGESVLSMPVVVGRPYRRTPVFSDTIRYVVFNPSWEVPARIATQDKLPLIKQDPGYIDAQGYQLLQGWGADERRVHPQSVDWPAVTARSFPYRLRQAPGPLNALGQVKFMFPNKFSVYLHDTPARELFAEDARAFSSGCIRLERPLDLAELLLRGSERWSRAAVDRVVAEGREQSVSLPEPVPVHLLYWTAWVDDEGLLHFREDIYGRDQPVLRELREDPPS